MEDQDNVPLVPGSFNRGEVFASVPYYDELQFDWELLPEPSESGTYAGQGSIAVANIPFDAKGG